MKGNNSDLKSLKPLLNLTTALAITPPYEFGTQPRRCSKAFKAYAIFMITANLTGYVFNLYGKVYHGVLGTFGATVNFADYVAGVFMTLTCASTVLITALWRPEQFKMILYNIEKFDSMVFSFLAICIDAFTWTNTLGLDAYIFYLPRNIMWYQFSVATSLIFFLALKIERRFKEMNNCLIRCSKRVNTTFLIPTQLIEYSITKKKNRPFNVKLSDPTVLKSIKLWYGDFVKVVEEFNCVFGLIILFAVLFNIANVVFYTHATLFYFSQNFGGEAVVNTVTWTVVTFLQTLLLAAACGRLTNEANRITIICYSLLSKVPSLPKTDYEVALREELLLIAEQTAICHPHVSAAGFFEVNLGMMGFIVASVTSYIIVIIQFM